MARWQPDAAGRLRDAALDLYAERGFDDTTVADIAERAGVTARTFFNHFGDKRDVLFGGSAHLQAEMERSVAEAPSSASPLETVIDALAVVGVLVSGDHEWSRRRREVILANVQLLERELLKLATLTRALVAGLRARGVDDDVAQVTAELGMLVFKVGFDRWAVADEDGRDVTAHMADVLAQLRPIETRD